MAQTGPLAMSKQQYQQLLLRPLLFQNIMYVQEMRPGKKGLPFRSS